MHPALPEAVCAARIEDNVYVEWGARWGTGKGKRVTLRVDQAWLDRATARGCRIRSQWGGGRSRPAGPSKSVIRQLRPHKRHPNKSEELFRRTFLQDADAVFEGLRFLLPGLDRAHYTPDWVVRMPETCAHRILCVEVKRRFAGGGSLLSYRDARRRFDSAREAWPMFRWVWAEVQPDGTWRMT